MSIKLLSKEDIEKIRSSYLIGSLEQLIEELILNSIDSKASHITVDLQSTTNQVDIIVTDNGKGMRHEEMMLVGQRYATSKLYESNCFGFRGESLNSIVAMCSSVTISSRISSLDPTLTKTIQPSTTTPRVTRSYVRDHQVGTTVRCNNIYGNQPVRKDFILQKLFMVGGLIHEIRLVIEHISLVHANISLSLLQNGSSLMNIVAQEPQSSSTCGVSRERLSYVLGVDKCTDMREVEGLMLDNDIPVRILISTNYPLHLSSYSTVKHCQYVFLNKRFVQKESDAIRKEMNSLYRSFLQKFRYHILEAHPSFHDNLLSLVPNFVVLIVHGSTKISDGNHRVEFLKGEGTIINLLRKTMHSFFNKCHPLYMNEVSNEKNVTDEIPIRHNTPPLNHTSISQRILSHRKTRISKPPAIRKSITELLQQSRKECVTFGQIAEHPIPTRDEIQKQERSETVELTRQMIQSMTVISQLDKKFIVTRIELNDLKCICLVDQHAADERIRVEDLLKQSTTNRIDVVSQRMDMFPGEGVQQCAIPNGLVVARAVDNPKLVQQISAYRQLLERWYWNFEVIQDSPYARNEGARVIMKTAPNFLGETLTVPDLVHFLEKLTEFTSSSTIPPGIHRIANYKACRSAVMFGDYLDRSQCENIIRSLSECDLPFQCAHGRPSMTVLFKYT